MTALICEEGGTESSVATFNSIHLLLLQMEINQQFSFSCKDFLHFYFINKIQIIIHLPAHLSLSLSFCICASMCVHVCVMGGCPEWVVTLMSPNDFGTWRPAPEWTQFSLAV